MWCFEEKGSDDTELMQEEESQREDQQGQYAMQNDRRSAREDCQEIRHVEVVVES